MKDDKRREEQLRAFQLKLGYEFRNAALLTEALTHSSYANENGTTYNERLEFLGDAVLELFTSERLFAAYPNFSEGELTRLRARLVCKNSLNDWASENGLKPLIRLGKSIKKPTDSMAADCVEALFGAVFSDGGYEAARRLRPLCRESAILRRAGYGKRPEDRTPGIFTGRGQKRARLQTCRTARPGARKQLQSRALRGRRAFRRSMGAFHKRGGIQSREGSA